MTGAERFPEGSVVVGVDGTGKDLPVLDWAGEEAQRRGSGLHVVFAFPWFPALSYGDVPADDAGLRQVGEQIVQVGVARVRARRPDVPLTSALVPEDPATVLVRASERASVVVVGARGLGGIAGRLLGSVSQRVVAHASSPVVVVRGSASMAPDGPVVVGLDAAEDAPGMLRFAFSEADRRGVGVHVVHAEPRPELRRELRLSRVHEVAESVWEERATEVQRLAEEWSLRYPTVPLDVRMVRRHPVEALLDESARASLLVVGRATRRGLTDLILGPVTRGVLQEASVVAVVPLERKVVKPRSG